MAAIICQSVSSLCNNLSSAACIPCQQCSRGLCIALKSPFWPYLAVTFMLNLPPLFWGIKGQLDLAGENHCNTLWLFVNGLMCLAHMVAALYIVRRIQEHRSPTQVGDTPVQATIVSGKGDKVSQSNYANMAHAVVDGKEDKASKTSYSSMEKGEKDPKVDVLAVQGVPDTTNTFMTYETDDGEANSMKRMTKVLCYDGGVAIYIIIFIAWTIWISKGVFALLSLGDDGLCDRQHMASAIMCGWAFMTVVCCAFACSLICLR